MSVRQRLRRDLLLQNSAMIMATTVLTSGFGAVYWIIAAHAYTTSTVGLAAALVSAMTLASVLSTFGIQAALVHRLPVRAAGREWSATLSAGLLAAAALALAGGTLVAIALPRASARFDLLGEDEVGPLFVAGVVLTTLATVLDFTFVAERAAVQGTKRNGIASLAKVALLALPVAVGFAGSRTLLGSWVAALAVGVIVGLLLVRRLDGQFRPTLTGIGGELRVIAPSLPAQHVINIAAGLPTFTLPLLVAAELSPAANAHFYATWMVGSAFFIISPAVSWSLFAEGRRGERMLAATLRRAGFYTAAMLLPLMALFLLFGHWLLELFGHDYAAAGGTLLVILVLSAIPDAVTNLFVATMRVRGTLAPAAAVNVGMAALTLLLAWQLLPPLGIAGAGWAWLAAQTAGTFAIGIYALATRKRWRRLWQRARDGELVAP